MGLFDSLLGSKKMTREKVMQMAQGNFADFSKADLSGLDLSGIAFSQNEFNQTNLKGAKLSKSRFSQCGFKYADLTGTNLDGATFEQCDFFSAKLEETTRKGATFSQCDLKNTCWEGMDGKAQAGSTFEQCSGVDEDDDDDERPSPRPSPARSQHRSMNCPECDDPLEVSSTKPNFLCCKDCKLLFVVKEGNELQPFLIKAPDDIDEDEFFASFIANLGFED